MIENAALALALAHAVGALRLLDEAAASAALEAVDLPGRAEVLCEAPLVIADGAHTPGSIEALARVLDARRPATLVAVASITHGKDAPSVLSSLVRRADVVIATAVEPSRSLAAETLARDLREAAPHAAIEAIGVPADALRAAMRHAGRDGIVCATGSMYMAGAARRLLGPQRRRPIRPGHPPVSGQADADAGDTFERRGTAIMTMLSPCHPGEILRDNLEAAGLSVTEAAARLGCTRQALSRLLNGKAGISPMMALALEGIGWSNAGLWMRLQASYELAQARRDRAFPEQRAGELRS